MFNCASFELVHLVSKFCTKTKLKKETEGHFKFFFERQLCEYHLTNSKCQKPGLDLHCAQQKCVMYLFLLFSRTSLLSTILPFSCLLCFLGCSLHITRFLGWFLRGWFPDGFVFPLPLLSFLPLILFLLSGTS